jgi:formylglycine-generating enzyme required for sulfatase activity
VDLRERLQAGLWLGELGDNLRYLRWAVAPSAAGGAAEADADDAAGRVGICLHPRHWRGAGHPGELLVHRIGDRAHHLPDAQHEWTLEQPAGRLAAYPVTVMEWAATQSQRESLPPALSRIPSGTRASARNNPLMPLTGITWPESRALTDWYSPVYADMVQRLTAWPGLRRWRAADYRLHLPTEAQREALARGPARPGQPQAAHTHPVSTCDPPLPLVFNHHATRWHRPNPVGVFARGLNPWGLDDLAGNVWNWCANTVDLQHFSYATPHGRTLAQTPAAPQPLPGLLALRGGSCNFTVDGALVASRDYSEPDGVSLNLGLRWLMCRQIF